MAASILDTPVAVVETFVNAWNAGDAHQLASVFDVQAEFVNVTGLWWHNRERIYKAHDYGFKVIFKNAHLEILRTKVKHLSDDIAIVHARTSLTDQTAIRSEEKPAKRTNILVFVVKRIEGSWICFTSQNTEVIPGKETWIASDSGEMKAVNYSKYEGED